MNYSVLNNGHTIDNFNKYFFMIKSTHCLYTISWTFPPTLVLYSRCRLTYFTIYQISETRYMPNTTYKYYTYSYLHSWTKPFQADKKIFSNFRQNFTSSLSMYMKFKSIGILEKTFFLFKDRAFYLVFDFFNSAQTYEYYI